MDYRSTMNLPRTNLPMKADLKRSEPAILRFWQEENIYQKILRSRKKGPLFFLHNAPHFTNGPAGINLVINKTLKDIILKYKTIFGFYSPFIPGWNVHGLPNEIRTIREYGIEANDGDRPGFRKKCLKNAVRYMEIQEDQFIRMGIMGSWDNPYTTGDPVYEAAVLDVFKAMVKNRMVYQGLRPVHWCPACKIPLADAEIEYKSRKSLSGVMKFKLLNQEAIFPGVGLPIHILVWTSRLWTLPGNQALALHPDEMYCLVKNRDCGYILSEAQAESIMEEASIEDFEMIESFPGKKLDYHKAHHPFIDRESLIIMRKNVSMDRGTGCVSVSPAHGNDDFEAALAYNLPILSPINGNGNFNNRVNGMENLFFEDAEPAILEIIRKRDNLFSSSPVSHSYPHCWQCGKPIVIRATNQWFIAVDMNDARKTILREMETLRWIPPSAEFRLLNMIKKRPDWCISRQRSWGIPIPIVECKGCGEVILNCEIIEKTEDIFSREGSDSWYVKDAIEFVPPGFECPKCHSRSFSRHFNIFDEWFESGISMYLLWKTQRAKWPADLFLEGVHLQRGWFQSSLFNSIATKGTLPCSAVFSRGWVLDEQGESMHPSLENHISSDEITEEFGADILRMQIASADNRGDIRISRKNMGIAGGSYRKIRNIIRFALGNLYDFDPEKDGISPEKLRELDKWILHKKNLLIIEVLKMLEDFKLHGIYVLIRSFLLHDFSSIYLESAKDILYGDHPESKERRSCQSAVYQVVRDIIILYSPVIPFSAEEFWKSWPPLQREYQSVLMAQLPLKPRSIINGSEESKWEITMNLRREAMSILEKTRNNSKNHKKNQKWKMDLLLNAKIFKLMEKSTDILRRLLNVAQVTLGKSGGSLPPGMIPSDIYPDTAFSFKEFEGMECSRCRRYYEKLEKEGICARCGKVTAEFAWGSPTASSKINQ